MINSVSSPAGASPWAAASLSRANAGWIWAPRSPATVPRNSGLSQATVSRRARSGPGSGRPQYRWAGLRGGQVERSQSASFGGDRLVPGDLAEQRDRLGPGSRLVEHREVGRRRPVLARRRRQCGRRLVPAVAGVLEQDVLVGRRRGRRRGARRGRPAAPRPARPRCRRRPRDGGPVRPGRPGRQVPRRPVNADGAGASVGAETATGVAENTARTGVRHRWNQASACRSTTSSRTGRRGGCVARCSAIARIAWCSPSSEITRAGRSVAGERPQVLRRRLAGRARHLADQPALVAVQAVGQFTGHARLAAAGRPGEQETVERGAAVAPVEQRLGHGAGERLHGAGRVEQVGGDAGGAGRHGARRWRSSTALPVPGEVQVTERGDGKAGPVLPVAGGRRQTHEQPVDENAGSREYPGKIRRKADVEVPRPPPRPGIHLDGPFVVLRADRRVGP